MTVKILLADDHALVRAGFSSLLETEADFMVVGEASTGNEALRMASDLHPDIVLMDISMPGITGIEATRRLGQDQPQVKVLILTVHEDKGLLLEAFDAGAAGFLLKRALKAELLNAISTVMKGQLYVHPSLLPSLINKTPIENGIPPGELDALTPRELEVLRLVAQGYTNAQVAELLTISMRTVEHHRANLMEKLQIDSRVELVRLAVEHNLLDSIEGEISS